MSLRLGEAAEGGGGCRAHLERQHAVVAVRRRLVAHVTRVAHVPVVVPLVVLRRCVLCCGGVRRGRALPPARGGGGRCARAALRGVVHVQRGVAAGARERQLVAPRVPVPLARRPLAERLLVVLRPHARDTAWPPPRPRPPQPQPVTREREREGERELSVSAVGLLRETPPRRVEGTQLNMLARPRGGGASPLDCHDVRGSRKLNRSQCIGCARTPFGMLNT
jgi:hypothetical protein